jgi:hypothetical protein
MDFPQKTFRTHSVVVLMMWDDHNNGDIHTSMHPAAAVSLAPDALTSFTPAVAARSNANAVAKSNDALILTTFENPRRS